MVTGYCIVYVYTASFCGNVTNIVFASLFTFSTFRKSQNDENI